MIEKRAFNFQDYKVRATKGLQENKSSSKYYTINKTIFHTSYPVWNRPAEVYDYNWDCHAKLAWLYTYRYENEDFYPIAGNFSDIVS